MLKISNVSKRFKKTQALDDFSALLDKGVHGLLGPNGAGKTTLLRSICGFYHIDGGSIQFDQQDIASGGNDIGYLPQKFGMFKELTVFEMMEYFAELKRIDRNKQKKYIEACVELVNLSDRLRSRISTLSGGMVRRLGIAQAILGNPKILLFDEPTSGLDPEERMRFKNIISQIKKNAIIIISTHIVEDVEASCDEIIVMNRGQAVAMGDHAYISGFAGGKVFIAEAEDENLLTGKFFIAKRTLNGTKPVLRVLSSCEQKGSYANPTVEDGYICIVKGL